VRLPRDRQNSSMSDLRIVTVNEAAAPSLAPRVVCGDELYFLSIPVIHTMDLGQTWIGITL
jgi:hypothetical protein